MTDNVIIVSNNKYKRISHLDMSSRLSSRAMVWTQFISVLVISFAAKAASQSLPLTCDSPIYCHGELLHTVQMAKLYNDSKSFVDLKLKTDVPTTLAAFDTLMSNTNNNPSKDDLQTFVNNYFEEGQELETWSPSDFKPEPLFLADITDPAIKQFAKDIVSIWPNLGRKVKQEVQAHPDQYSLVYVDNGLIVPGGRFREFYYWDSYWIVNGLIISEMCDTARGMIENFLSMVDRFGFVPNGGRVYYLQRSQPPLLTPMAKKYVEECPKHSNWLQNNIEMLARELKYWSNKTVDVVKNGKTYTLAHYISESLGPRPESYSEDYNTASLLGDAQKQELYNELKSAAESGWDFSSRWLFDSNGGTAANLTGIQTRRVIPVDLNAFLCGAYKDIAHLYKELNNTEQSNYWLTEAYTLQDAIKNVLWNEEDGIWYDYDVSLNRQRKYFAASNAAPLWTSCFDNQEAETYGNKVTKYLTKPGVDILAYPGGIPTTLDESGEQWDFPNCWPPLQAIVIQGLQNSGDPEAIEVAKVLADRWVRANLIGYTETKDMFEKYDANTPGGYGGGGEYVVQSGFGWTNGVVLEFINEYFRPKYNCYDVPKY